MSNVNRQNNLNESLSLNFLHVLLVEVSNYLGSTQYFDKIITITSSLMEEQLKGILMVHS